MDINCLKIVFSCVVCAMLATLMLSAKTLKILGSTVVSQTVRLNNTEQSVNDLLQIKPSFVTVKSANAFLFSALKHSEHGSYENVGNIVPNNRHKSEHIVITGWYVRGQRSYNSLGMPCCFYHRDGRFSSGAGEKRKSTHENSKYHFSILQLVCPVYSTKPPVIKISVTEEDSACSTNLTHYIDVETIKQHTVDGVALLAKVLYDSLNASYLIEWFEAQRFLGVDKIFCYLHGSLNGDAKKVIKYYEEIGLAKVAAFEVPENDTYTRRFGGKNIKTWTDIGVALHDWQERMNEYKYAVHLDPDEILIPENMIMKNSLKRYLGKRFRSNKEISLMRFLTMVHMTSWDAANPDHELFIGRQSSSTIAMRDRQKYAFKPGGIVPASCTSHSCRTKPGYKSEFIRDNSAVIHHFRACRREWKNIARKSTMKHRQLFIEEYYVTILKDSGH